MPVPTERERMREHRSGASREELVSVVIPCFNQGAFVNEALESVFAQTWPAWDVIVINDGSTDDTAEILRKLDHPRVRVVHQENGGLANARNTGFRNSSARFVLPLDADDVLLPEMIEACMEVMARKKRLGFVYTDVQFFGADDFLWRHKPYDFVQELEVNDVSVCALVRKQAWVAAGGYSSAVVPGVADWDFWIRCGASGWHGEAIPRPLFLYRVRPDSMWARTRLDMDLVYRQLAEQHPDLYSAPGKARGRGGKASVRGALVALRGLFRRKTS